MTRGSLGALAAVVLGLCCAAVLLVANLVNRRNAALTQREVDASWDVLRKSEEVLSLLRDAEIGQRGYLLVGRRKYLEPYTSAVEKVFPAIEELEVRVQSDPDQKTRTRTLRRLAGEKMSEMRVTIEMADAGNRDGALATVDTDLGKARMDEIRGIVADLQQEERAAIAAHATRATATARRVFLTSILAVLIVAVSLLFLVLRFAPAPRRSTEAPAG
jgi:CHASE3 domain sensor protein